MDSDRRTFREFFPDDDMRFEAHVRFSHHFVRDKVGCNPRKLFEEIHPALNPRALLPPEIAIRSWWLEFEERAEFLGAFRSREVEDADAPERIISDLRMTAHDVADRHALVISMPPTERMIEASHVVLVLDEPSPSETSAGRTTEVRIVTVEQTDDAPAGQGVLCEWTAEGKHLNSETFVPATLEGALAAAAQRLARNPPPPTKQAEPSAGRLPPLPKPEPSPRSDPGPARREDCRTLREFFPDAETRHRVHMGFAHRFLPAYVRQNPFAFFSYVHGGTGLEPMDPQGFLHSRWMLFEEQFGFIPTDQGSPFVSSFVFRRPTDVVLSLHRIPGHAVMVITMPPPERQPEATHVIVVLNAPAEEVGKWPRDVTARVFTCEKAGPGPTEKGLLCEWAADGTHKNFQIAVPAAIPAILAAVNTVIVKKLEAGSGFDPKNGTVSSSSTGPRSPGDAAASWWSFGKRQTASAPKEFVLAIAAGAETVQISAALGDAVNKALPTLPMRLLGLTASTLPEVVENPEIPKADLVVVLLGFYSPTLDFAKIRQTDDLLIQKLRPRTKGVLMIQPVVPIPGQDEHMRAAGVEFFDGRVDVNQQFNEALKLALRRWLGQ